MIFKTFFAMLAVNGDLFVPIFWNGWREQSEGRPASTAAGFCPLASDAQNRPRLRSAVR